MTRCWIWICTRRLRRRGLDNTDQWCFEKRVSGGADDSCAPLTVIRQTRGLHLRFVCRQAEQRHPVQHDTHGSHPHSSAQICSQISAAAKHKTQSCQFYISHDSDHNDQPCATKSLSKCCHMLCYRSCKVHLCLPQRLICICRNYFTASQVKWTWVQFMKIKFVARVNLSSWIPFMCFAPHLPFYILFLLFNKWFSMCCFPGQSCFA